MRKYIILFLLTIILAIVLSGCIGEKNENVKELNMTGKTGQTGQTKSDVIKFITVGDPHIKVGNLASEGGNERLSQVVEFADNSDANFIVFLGDIGNTGSSADYIEAKRILKNLTIPYYTIAGNHDLKYCTPHPDNTNEDGCDANQALMYEKYFGPQTKMVNYKGYQLLFAGIKANYKVKNGKYIENYFNWIFDFNRSDLDFNKPTILFMHGVLKPSPDPCNNWSNFARYGESMLPYLGKFNYLIATYSGHVHFDSEQIADVGKSKGVHFITNDALVDAVGASGGECSIPAGDYVGYSVIDNRTLDYKLVPYS